MLSDGSTLAPSNVEDRDGAQSDVMILRSYHISHPSLVPPGLKATIESIDNRSDFKVYMQNYGYAHGGQVPRGPRREGPWEEGFVRVFFRQFNRLV